MEIVKKQSGGVLELRINGRLDAYWADHLGAALDEALRAGADDIRLDMAAVAYMSSVGIRVLLRYYKETRRLQGSLRVQNPSAAVRTVLELAGLQVLLLEAVARVEEGVSEPAARSFEHGGAAFEVFELPGAAGFEAGLIGDPDPAAGARAADCRTLRAGDDVLAVGLGAFGRDFDDCSGRFGEFLAAGGAAAFLPTDGTNAPDSLVATGAFVPEIQVVNGIACEGRFARFARFEPTAGAPLPLQSIVDACLSLSGGDAAAIAILAESAGLMGAALRRPPHTLPREAAFTFAFPAVRAWLSFTPERAFARRLTLIAGIAARRDIDGLARFVRPLAGEGWPAGHFHAAAFSYQPLRRGRLELPATLSALFESAALEGILHLLNDDRPIVGSGQSELVRGACWVGPITRVGRRA
ncbi:MAG: STAS domain-containing protein [Deltaproteobacteria bacterium]|nr:STAS domain-containing protein [Deltaproteobacteria bacterium]